MAISMPPLTKTYTHVLNNRLPYLTSILTDITSKLLYNVFSVQLIANGGFTCIGSSTGVTGNGNINHAGGSNTWTSAAVPVVQGATTTSLQSWIIFKDGNGVEWLVAYQGATTDCVKISMSPGGNWTLNGTNNAFQPTATDEVVVATNTFSLVNSTTSIDRIWNLSYSTDKKIWRLWVLRNNLCQAMVAGETFATIMTVGSVPAAIGWASTNSNGNQSGTGGVVGSQGTNLGWAARSGASNIAGGGGGEGFAGSLSSAAFAVERPELQAGSPIVPVSIISSTASFRGKVGNRFDVWALYDNSGVTDTTPVVLGNNLYTCYGGHGMFPFDGSLKVIS